MITRINDAMNNVKSVAIAGHIRPDGDCVGSTLGVYNYIRKVYPDVKVQVYLDPMAEKFSFLKGADLVRQAGDKEPVYDLFIVLDCGALDRLNPTTQEVFEAAGKTLCIDHHLSRGQFADENYIFPEASSTCELVYDLMDPAVLDKNIAECLYVGMVSDTGMFQYSCTHASTMNAAGELMDLGIDYSWIIDHTFQQRSFQQNKVLGYLLNKSEYYEEAKTVTSWMDTEEMQRFSVTPKDLDFIVAQLRTTSEAEVAAFLYETEPGTYKISFRASGDVNVAAIAETYGGGGHIKAAGGSVSGHIQEVMPELIERIKAGL